MADNNDLKVVVGLDLPKSKIEVEKDLRLLEDILSRSDKGKLQIAAGLNTGKTIGIINQQIKQIQKSINGVKLTPQLDISGQSGSQALHQIQDSANATRKTLQDLRQDLLNIDKTRADFRFKAGVNDEGEDLQKTLENAKKLFSAYKDIDDIQFKWSADESGEVNKISAIIKSVTGQVETLRFELQQTNGVYNDVFSFVGSSSGDTGIAKAAKEAEKLSVKTEETRAKYTRLLEEFKSSNSAIQTGLTQPIAKFEEVLNGLGTTHSISDVINQFEKLKTSAAEISQYLGTTNNSFNKNTNAINNYNQMDDAIKRIEASYGNLTVKNDKLGTSVTNLRSLYEALVKTEKKQGGYTATWAQEYQKVNAVLKEVKTNIEAAVRAESSSKEADKNSQYQIQARHLKSIVEAQKQIVQLSRQRLSADEAETAELDRQIKNARQRIRDNTNFLVDKDLYSGVAKQIADSTKAMDEQLKLIGAKQTDNIKKNYQDMSNAISKTVEKLKSLQSQPLFETKGNSGVAQLSADIKALIKDYEKLQKSMMGSTPNSQNLDHFAEKLVEIDQRSKTVQTTFGNIKTSVAESAKAEVTAQKEVEKLAQSYTKMGATIANAVTEIGKLKQSPILSDSKNKDYVVQIESEIQRLIDDYVKLHQTMSSPNNQTQANYSVFAKELEILSQRTMEAKAALEMLNNDSVNNANNVKAFNDQIKSVERTMTNLDKMSGASIFSKYWNNDDVKQIQYRITQLKEDYKGALDVLKNNDIGTPKFKAAQDVIARLDEKFKELGVDIRSVRSELSNENDISRFQKQVANLTNDITTLQNNIHLTDSQKAGLSGLLNEVGLAKDKATLDEIVVKLAKLRGEINQATAESKNFDQISKSVEKVITDLNAMGRTPIFNTHSNNAGVIEFQGKIKSLSDTAKQVKADLNALGDNKAIPPELKARVEDLKKKFDELDGSNKTLQANLRQNDGWARTERQIQTLTARIKEYMAVNTKAAKKYSGQFDGLLSGLSQAEINKDSEAVRRLSADFQILRSNIKAAGDQGKTLFQEISAQAKKFSAWLSITSLVMRAIHSLKQMVTSVKEIDQAMTSLKKVTNETASAYDKFLDDTRVKAQQLHSSIVDIVEQTEIWVKLGHDLDTASKLAEVSMMYAKVGDVDNESAVKDLVAAMKAFNIEADNAIDIVSMLDKLNNEFAVSAKDLGEGLTVTASAMAAGGNSLEKTLSLMTGAGEITQDLQGVSNALRTISMRIRGFNQPLKQLYRLKPRDGQDRGKICNVLFSYAG